MEHVPHISDEHFVSLRLLRSYRVGPSTFYRLLGEHKTPQRALDALHDVAKNAGVANYKVCDSPTIENELRAGQRHGARLISVQDDAYPAWLAMIKDPPPFIWVKGNVDILQSAMVAMVGARHCTALNTRFSKDLAQGIGEAGYTTVSGLARGIDSAVHQASITTGTVAVFAGGLDSIYPEQNTTLAYDILKNGAWVSEQPFGAVTKTHHFIQRNRIVAGIAQALVIVEATEKSGTLSTAEFAIEQGKDIYAVPGHPFDGRSNGCNRLIRDGATLVRRVQDITEHLSPTTPRPLRASKTTHKGAAGASTQVAKTSMAKKKVPIAKNVAYTSPPSQRILQEKQVTGGGQHSDLQLKILEKLSHTPIYEDHLIIDLEVSYSVYIVALMELELALKVQRMQGGLVALR